MKIWGKDNFEEIWQGGLEMAGVDYLLSLNVNDWRWLIDQGR